MSDTSGYEGFLGVFDALDPMAELWFVINRIINRRCTASLVRVEAVHADPAGGPPTVDILPLVHQVTGGGQVQPHGVIYNVPSFRVQRGGCAIKMDPKKDDIGLAVFASHDISTVKKTRKPSAPGSLRRMDWADGLYFGSFLGGPVTRYVEFTDSAINVVDPTAVNVTAPVCTVNASTRAVINSPEVDLGGTGGAAVARVGDTVSGGVITSGSAKVKAT